MMKRPRIFETIQITLVLTCAVAFSSLPVSPGTRRCATSKLKSSTYGNEDRTMDSFDQALKQLQAQNRIKESLEIRVSPPLESSDVDAPLVIERPPTLQPLNQQPPQASPTPVSTPKRSNLRDALERLELKTAAQPAEDQNTEGDMPKQDSAGIYEITSKEQHAALLKANPDKLIVMKFTAGYCQACAALKPKFRAIVNDPQYKDMPIVWANFKASPNNKAFFRRLNVLALPTVHFYDGQYGLEENFQCGPAKVEMLVQKLTQFLDSRVDPVTKRLMPPSYHEGTDAPAKVREIRIGDELITQEHIDFLREDFPFFEELTDEEFDELLSKASLQTFLPGDIVIRQGLPGNALYVVKSGLLEMSIKSRFDDPISTPPHYLGAVVNTLTKFDYFGERALTTGQPLSASVRALEKSRCFVFKAEDIPEGSILSQKRRATAAYVDKLTERYELPHDYEPAYQPHNERDDSILDLLVRFRQIRQAARCFDYFIKSKTLLGDKGEIARRSILVSKLTESQKQEIKDVFNMADVYGKGRISILELRRFMESARKKVSDTELTAMITRANPSAEGAHFGVGITLDEFMGIMAEAGFYYLFTETFQELDTDNTGYVRAGDLDEVLDGVRDLITGDRKSIIDVEDQDVQVDYEQFARMLLGASLWMPE